jgi:hypothetical protein
MNPYAIVCIKKNNEKKAEQVKPTETAELEVDVNLGR